MPVSRTYDVDNAVSDASSSTATLPSSLRDQASGFSSRASSRTLTDPYTVLSQQQRSQRPKKGTKRESIVICGITLAPTVVFDTFWRFAAERKAIDDRRRSGKQWPWTEDPILQSYHFCNTFRVLDKLSQYVIREVIEKESQRAEEVAFRIILFNLFTKIETWELLRDQVGPLEWATYDRAKYAAVLHKAKARGLTLYTGAFQKPAPRFELAPGYVNHLILLEVLMDNEIYIKCRRALNMADIYEFLISFPSMGEFATYQLMLNLSYSKLLNFSENDFVVPGPGASSGLVKMFGQSAISAGIRARHYFETEVIRWLVDTQKHHFERLGLKPPVLGGDIPMSVADVEHTLCEVDKYSRLAHPRFKGKRTELWRKFEPKSRLSTEPLLPKAWQHPYRKFLRVRKEKRLVVQKRYSVSQIKSHRDGKKGREYLVYWWGYPDSDATWEPEWILEHDAKGAIEDYRARIKRSRG